jgi:hypothetical protein
MKLDKACSLFFGTKVDSKLREGLALSKPGDKKYFDGTSEEFLRVIELGEDKDKERWIGKVIKAGPAVTEVDDIQRNILSILRRVAPNARVAASAVKIFVLHGAGAQPAVIDDEGGDEDEVIGGSSTGSGGGPYITY